MRPASGAPTHALRLLPALLLALGVGRPSATATAANAQELIFLAFGDSITDGYGDTSNPGGGYPTRLQRWLRQEGYDCVVESHGVGGETTSSGLSRIDSVLAGGGDYLLLMEGTNDISRASSIESIASTSTKWPSRPRRSTSSSSTPRSSRGFRPRRLTPATPRPRPWRWRSADHGRGVHRAVADQFTLFEGLPDVFENYYYYDPDVIDIVGPPQHRRLHRDGGTLPRDPPAAARDPGHRDRARRPAPLSAGQLAAFGRRWQRRGPVRPVSSGTSATAATPAHPPPDDLTIFYIFLHPGTLHRHRARTRPPTAPSPRTPSRWSFRAASRPGRPHSTLLPLIVESADGQVVSDLVLINSSFDFGVVEAAFLPRSSTTSRRRCAASSCRPRAPTNIDDILGTAFGIGAGRGALRVTLYAFPGARRRYSPRAPSCTPRAIPTAATAPPSPGSRGRLDLRRQADLRHSARLDDSPSTLMVANLDGVRGTVSFDLYDAARRRRRFRRPRARRERHPPALDRRPLPRPRSRARRRSGPSSPPPASASPPPLSSPIRRAAKSAC